MTQRQLIKDAIKNIIHHINPRFFQLERIIREWEDETCMLDLVFFSTDFIRMTSQIEYIFAMPPQPIWLMDVETTPLSQWLDMLSTQPHHRVDIEQCLEGIQYLSSAIHNVTNTQIGNFFIREKDKLSAAMECLRRNAPVSHIRPNRETIYFRM